MSAMSLYPSAWCYTYYNPGTSHKGGFTRALLPLPYHGGNQQTIFDANIPSKSRCSGHDVNQEFTSCGSSSVQLMNFHTDKTVPLFSSDIIVWGHCQNLIRASSAITSSNPLFGVGRSLKRPWRWGRQDELPVNILWPVDYQKCEIWCI